MSSRLRSCCSAASQASENRSATASRWAPRPSPCEARKRRSGSPWVPHWFDCTSSKNNRPLVNGASLRVPRRGEPHHDVLVAGRLLHAGAGGVLADGLAIQLLPRRLAVRDVHRGACSTA